MIKGLSIIGVMLLLAYWSEDKPKAPPAKTTLPVKVLHRQTPEEFQRQSECGDLREKFDMRYRREHPYIGFITITSRYNPVSNRCFVRVRSGLVDSDGDELYDGQTMQVLAHADRIMSPTSPWLYTASIGRGGGTDYNAWNTAKDFIERAMQEDQ